MKKIATLVAAVALLAASSVATAADNAWFTLEGGPGTVVTSGPGNTLIVEKDAGSSATLRIGYNFNSSFGPMASWSIALNTAGDLGATSSFGNGANGGLSGYTVNTGTLANGSSSFNVGQVSTNNPANGTTGLAYLFDLTVSAGPLGSGASVTGDFGGAEQAYSSGFYWYGFVGANPISYGRTGGYTGAVDVTPGWGSLPVIIVRNVPEPATIALLGLGALALIRRRK